MTEQAVTSYDVVHYPSKAYAYAHPDRLAVLGTLFGMKPAAVATARVLELGCGEGGHLIPMASRLPEARFVGIDLSRRAIELGQRHVQTLGLRNIDLEVGDIAALDLPEGSFDYIIAHGVYSWVPVEVAQALMAACRRLLAPEGIAYVSYNTLPGWHLHGITRTVMQVHAQQFTDPMEKVQQGQALVRFLSTHLSPDQSAYGAAMKRAVGMMDTFSDAYFFHDFLAETNRPLLFGDFVSEAQAEGLQYLGDACFGDMMPTNLPEPVRATLDRVAPDLVRLEQYMDLVRGTAFRRSLLCHGEVSLKRELSDADLRDLWVISNSGPKDDVDVSWDDRTAAVFEASTDDGQVTVTSPLAKAALSWLRDVHPREVAFPQLVAQARAMVGGTAGDDDAAHLGAILIRAYGAGVVDLLPRQRCGRDALPEHPVADPYAAYRASTEDTTVTNLRHQVVQLSRFERELLRLLDGSRGASELHHALVQKVKEGALTVRVDGEASDDADLIDEAMRNIVPLRLRRLWKVGLISPT